MSKVARTVLAVDTVKVDGVPPERVASDFQRWLAEVHPTMEAKVTWREDYVDYGQA